MTRTEKISAIYAEMANKEETFWCKVLVDTQKRFGNRLESESGIEDTIIGKIRDPDDFRKFNLEDNWPSYDDWQYNNIDEEEFTCITEVIWHPVMIWDVLDYLEDKRFYCEKCKKIVDWRDVSDCRFWWEYYCDICNNEYLVDIKSNILFDWSKKREPIEAQSDECVDFVYSLIPSISRE